MKIEMMRSKVDLVRLRLQVEEEVGVTPIAPTFYPFCGGFVQFPNTNESFVHVLGNTWKAYITSRPITKGKDPNT